MAIVEKLARIQSELKCAKNQFNSYGNYNYRSCEDILESVKPLLAKYKCVLTMYDNIELIGNRYYIKAVVKLQDVETSEEITSQAFAREEEIKKGMDASQITGSTSSYARKYALNGMFLIDDTKDADTMDNREEVKTEPLATPNQIKMIREGMDANRIERMLTHYKCNKLERLTLKQASEVITTLKKEGKANGTNQGSK